MAVHRRTMQIGVGCCTEQNNPETMPVLAVIRVFIGFLRQFSAAQLSGAAHTNRCLARLRTMK
jgi:hypothetical protein